MSTESRRWMSGTAGHVSTYGGRVRGMLLVARFGGLGLKTMGDGFRGFGPQNPGGGPDAGRTTRGGIGEFASKRSYQ